MIQAGVPYHVPHAAAHAGLVVVRAEHKPPQLSEHDRPGALGARLEGHVERAVVEAISAERRHSLLDGEQFGVGGGVVAGDRGVVRPGNDDAVAGDDGADGHFVELDCQLGLGERRLDPGEVGLVRHEPVQARPPAFARS